MICTQKRRNDLASWSSLGLALICFFAAVACGKGTSKPKETASDSHVISGGSFKALIVRSREVNGIESEQQMYFVQAIHQGPNHLAVEKVIECGPGPATEAAQDDECYLGWEEGAIPGPVVRVTYSTGHLSRTGERHLNPIRREAKFDRVQRHWLIPFSQLLEESGGEGDAGDLHWADLELERPDGQVQFLKLSFRLDTGIDALGSSERLLSRDGDSGQVSPRRAGVQLAREGWAIDHLTLRNPSRRSIAFWIKTVAQGLTWLSGIRVPRYSFQGYRAVAPTGVLLCEPQFAHVFETWLSRQDLEFRGVELMRGDSNGSELMSPNSEGWAKVEVAPLEEITLRMLVTPRSPGVHCSLPVPERRIIQFEEMKFVSSWNSSMVPTGRTLEKIFPEIWNVAGVKVAGSYGIQVRVSSTQYEFHHQDTDSARVRTLLNVPPARLSRTLGTLDETWAPWSCQGWF